MIRDEMTGFEETPMVDGRRRFRIMAAMGLALWLGLGHGAKPALAYPDFGMGFGFGGMVPSVSGFLNDHSIATIGVHAAARPGPLRAPVPVSRDTEFFTRYDADTRLAMENRVARTPRAPRNRPTQAAATRVAERAAEDAVPVRKIAPLASFFNAMNQLVWPADSPTAGELDAKRSATDSKTLEMFIELRNKGYAYLSTATEARTLLLDYGRPALKLIRETSTPALSEGFHAFLRSLYDSIGDTTNQVLR